METDVIIIISLTILFNVTLATAHPELPLADWWDERFGYLSLIVLIFAIYWIPIIYLIINLFIK